MLFAAAFAANFRFAEEGSDYFAQSEPPSPVRHFWSLGVEEQFYLVWPALLAIALFGVLCTATWPPARLRPYDRVAASSRRLGVGFVDTRGWFCFENQCPTVIAETITYRDYRHLTVAYSLRLAGTFRAAFRAAQRR